jgi:hypothetical protein
LAVFGKTLGYISAYFGNYCHFSFIPDLSQKPFIYAEEPYFGASQAVLLSDPLGAFLE